MELYQARDNFIIKDAYFSLWCNRSDGGLVPRQGVHPNEAFDPVCKGIVYGVIGKIQFFPGGDWKLLVITKRTLLGLFPGNHEVYRVDRVAYLPLSPGDVPELELDPCEKHQSGGRGIKRDTEGQQKSFQQTWKSIKTAATNIKENVKSTSTTKEPKDRERDKLERRLVEELLKMFNDSDSFYYSPTGDITNTLQRQCGDHYDHSLPLWKRVDKRFFWNSHMLHDLINNEDPLASSWILPVIQGYCSIVHCHNMFEEDDMEEQSDIQIGALPPEEFDLLLISRRSIFRAGTRYKRRGVDDDGEVANYVETEQIVRTEIHSVSFVQVRGSVPVFWSQPGYKYRPPPRLDKDEMDTQAAFRHHFSHQLSLYGGVVVVNLVDQTGREKIISDVFMRHILAYNCPLLTYITFDFHEYCRGMKFENVSVLVDSIGDVIKDMRYCWTDPKGIICEQRSVFRVNCMDCLDRTNVVQAALARHLLEMQLRKLGKLMPDQTLPASIRAPFKEMWANNGDAISRQYAGTAALKGDFTRTGERKFTGLMKDGYNSANRYYLNRFKAAYRQTLIDMMLGNPPTEDLSALIDALRSDGQEEEQWTMEREECVAQLVIHCQWLLLSQSEECLGGWALVDPFFTPEGESATQDQDVILLLTYHAYYVASYDDEAEQITQYERIAIEDVEKIEIGFEPHFNTRYLFIRVHFKIQGVSGHFHTLRTIQHRTPEEAKAVLLGIADAFSTARGALGLKITETKLDRKRSKPLPDVIQISSKSRLSGWSKPNAKVKSKHELAAHEENSTFQTRLRDKTPPKTLQSFLEARVGDMPRPYSDSCLLRSVVDEDFNGVRERTGTFSAPTSSASSSVSGDDSDSGATDEMFEKAGEELLEMQMRAEQQGAKEGSDNMAENGSKMFGENGHNLAKSTERNEKIDSSMEGDSSIQNLLPEPADGDDLSAVPQPEVNPQAEVIGVSAQSGKSPAVNLNFQGSRIFQVSYKSLASSDDVKSAAGEGTAEISPQESTNRFRFTGRLLGNRSPGNRSPGTQSRNLFASAQSKSRASFSDLRSKLSNLSFANRTARNRSPRLTHNHVDSPDGLVEQKKHRRRKCQTKIIEL
ncbi:phosphatidylinositide phosphatase SAC2 [Nematostella vectensis]|uniref:phosphatidylinositide phosphatase SAC2 n=1 Tax=Nematostella vectensis TaxID=45351 RepID=UPI002076ED0E|nr:phosphatidylinositide phosphatase SAC2 [Nematostella vectensis]